MRDLSQRRRTVKEVKRVPGGSGFVKPTDSKLAGVAGVNATTTSVATGIGNLPITTAKTRCVLFVTEQQSGRGESR